MAEAGSSSTRGWMRSELTDVFAIVISSGCSLTEEIGMTKNDWNKIIEENFHSLVEDYQRAGRMVSSVDRVMLKNVAMENGLRELISEATSKCNDPVQIHHIERDIRSGNTEAYLSD